jgi:hypothetical protein
MEEAIRAQRVIVLHEGRVALDGPPHEIYASRAIDAFGLALPPAVELTHRLRKHIPILPVGILTPDALAEAIAEVLA